MVQCIYCSDDFKTQRGLRTHLHKLHKDELLLNKDIEPSLDEEGKHPPNNNKQPVLHNLRHSTSSQLHITTRKARLTLPNRSNLTIDNNTSVPGLSTTTNMEIEANNLFGLTQTKSIHHTEGNTDISYVMCVSDSIKLSNSVSDSLTY
eukprot:GAHX01005087.1.p1 GENE.GAHX01005087.1~~GAHX01005087.1.p1  ORF type:complete len:148 (+),score=19.09 GAHX01005087.1:197-640(+)